MIITGLNKMLREKFSLPMLKIETDYTGQGDAQLENRMSAFFENLNVLSKRNTCSYPKNENYSKKFYIAGIDSGSTSTEAVILDSEHNIVSSAVVPTGVSVPDSAKKAFKVALQKVSLSEERIVRTVSTGYGRTAVTFGNRDITEITCHGKGAYFLNPAIRTVIDMGGQDSKIIRLNSDGSVKDFAMNDKCAAGTGRFLEMMAQSLGITLEEISLCGLKWDEEITISSMCSVFAQSEVVSLIAKTEHILEIVISSSHFEYVFCFCSIGSCLLDCIGKEIVGYCARLECFRCIKGDCPWRTNRSGARLYDDRRCCKKYRSCPGN